MLPKTFFPTHDENKMANEGNVELARKAFIENRLNNLDFLLSNRYRWMNDYLTNTEKFVELGAGPGFSKFYIDCPGLILTDVVDHPWIDAIVDALDTPFEDESLDGLICCHMIHHLAHPVPFFNEMRRKLKIGGVMLIHEVETSFFMRVMLWMMRHEGWSYEIDVFDSTTIANNPEDPWSANCAIPELLFLDEERFIRSVPGFAIEKNELNECLTLPLSGGVIAKTKTLELPILVLRIIHVIDRILIAVAPGVFAFGRSVVLRRIS